MPHLALHSRSPIATALTPSLRAALITLHVAVGSDTNGTVTINENGGIFNAALRPTANWNVNGTVEVLYNDNSFTPVGARQTKHYRVHTMYRPKPWATISGAFNDRERHNNTNNNAGRCRSWR
jgi:hypothetical protein